MYTHVSLITLISDYVDEIKDKHQKDKICGFTSYKSKLGSTKFDILCNSHCTSIEQVYCPISLNFSFIPDNFIIIL